MDYDPTRKDDKRSCKDRNIIMDDSTGSSSTTRRQSDEEESQPVLRSMQFLPVRHHELDAPLLQSLRPCVSKPLVKDLILKDRSKATQFSEPKEVSNDVISIPFDLTWDQLVPLPSYWHLERNHRKIPCKTPSSLVSKIFACLRSRSVEVEYEPGKFSCKTADFVKFRINMFSCVNNNETDERSVIVEIQRRSGCPCDFKDECRAILGSIDGDDTPTLHRVPPFLNVPISSLKCVQDAKLEVLDPHVVVPDVLSNVQADLDSGKNDVQLLALQSMEHITNPLVAPLGIAEVASIGLLQSTAIRQSVETLIAEGQLRSAAMEDLDKSSQYEDDFLDQTRNLALKVLHNILKVLAGHTLSARSTSLPTLSDIIKNQEAWFLDGLFPCLLKDLENVRVNSHDALLATQVLSMLVAASPSFRACAINGGIVTALKQVISFGASSHLQLHREALSLTDSLARE